MGKLIDCPYCEEYVNIDGLEFEDNVSEVECEHCGKEFEVEVEYEPTFTSRKIVYKTCSCCKNVTVEYNQYGSCFPFPKEYSYDGATLCKKCYSKLAFMEMRGE